MPDRASPGPTEAERAAWTAQAAAWDRWADPLERMAERFNQPMVEAAGAKPGERVLDLASGVGEPGLTLYKAIQPGGTLVLSDLAEAMIRGASRRFQARGLAAGAIVQDAQRLAFADRSFDLVTCRFGIMFFPEPRAALDEVARVLVPGGRTVFAVWGPLADNPMFQVTRGAIDAVLGPDPAQRDPFRHAASRVLEAEFAAAGLAGYAEHDLSFERCAKAGEPFWRAPLEMTGGARLAGAEASVWRALDAEVERRLEAFRDGDAYRLGAHIRFLTARRPV